MFAETNRIRGMLNLDFYAVALKKADICSESEDMAGYDYWNARAAAYRAKMDGVRP